MNPSIAFKYKFIIITFNVYYQINGKFVEN